MAQIHSRCMQNCASIGVGAQIWERSAKTRLKQQLAHWGTGEALGGQC